MIRTFRYPLHPTASQAATLEVWLGACCELYNAALQERRDAWSKGTPVRYNDQQKSLTEIRSFDPLYQAVPAKVSRSALVRIDQAFKMFFRRCQSGAVAGYPRFKAKRRYRAFSISLDESTRCKIENERIWIQKLGFVKLNLYRPLKGRPLELQIKKTSSGEWFVGISCDLGDAPIKVPVRKAVGIDLGLRSFAVLSDNREVENPKFFQAGQELVARRQRVFARRQPGSAAREKAKVLLAKAHEHVRNQRMDHARKLAAELYSEFDLVAYEALDVQAMMKDGFQKPLKDAAWAQFLRCLTSKAEKAGKWAVPVDPRGTSQRCSACGATVTKTLAEREHRCVCGFVTDRDHNAALNVLALGRSAVLLAEGVVDAALEPIKK